MTQNLSSLENNNLKDKALKKFINTNFISPDDNDKSMTHLKIENLLRFFFNTYQNEFKQKRYEGLIIYSNLINIIKENISN